MSLNRAAKNRAAKNWPRKTGREKPDHENRAANAPAGSLFEPAPLAIRPNEGWQRAKPPPIPFQKTQSPSKEPNTIKRKSRSLNTRSTIGFDIVTRSSKRWLIERSALSADVSLNFFFFTVFIDEQRRCPALYDFTVHNNFGHAF